MLSSIFSRWFGSPQRQQEPAPETPASPQEDLPRSSAPTSKPAIEPASIIEPAPEQVNKTDATSTTPPLFPTTMETIWVTEQFDGAGILYSCIACCDEAQAKDCYESFEAKLSQEQRDQGWNTQQRQVTSWDDVPVSALKLSR